MKIFISSDMEGAAGVVDWDQCRPGGAQYEHYAELLTREVNAAIEGALSAGATELVVNDSHGKMANLRPDRLAGRARYVSGRYKPMYMMEGLDSSFDAAFFVAYHGSMEADASVLSHTYYPAAIAEVRLNGTVAGESGINALAALGHGVPVVLVTGDETTIVEAERFFPGVQSAAVKRSISRFAADSLHPEAACDLIRERAAVAVQGASAVPPIAIDLPVTMEIRFRTSDYADLAGRVGGVCRTGALSARMEHGDPLELYRSFVTVVLLCRGLVE